MIIRKLQDRLTSFTTLLNMSCIQACSIVLLFLTLKPDPVLGLEYHYSNGAYFVGSVDYRGRPSGQGQYHNSSGHLGKKWIKILHFSNLDTCLVLQSRKKLSVWIMCIIKWQKMDTVFFCHSSEIPVT